MLFVIHDGRLRMNSAYITRMRSLAPSLAQAGHKLSVVEVLSFLSETDDSVNVPSGAKARTPPAQVVPVRQETSWAMPNAYDLRRWRARLCSRWDVDAVVRLAQEAQDLDHQGLVGRRVVE